MKYPDDTYFKSITINIRFKNRQTLNITFLLFISNELLDILKQFGSGTKSCKKVTSRTQNRDRLVHQLELT